MLPTARKNGRPVSVEEGCFPSPRLAKAQEEWVTGLYWTGSPEERTFTMEVDQLPQCCKDQLGEIGRIMESFRALEIVLALSPVLVTPRPRGISSVIAALWNLAKA